MENNVIDNFRAEVFAFIVAGIGKLRTKYLQNLKDNWLP